VRIPFPERIPINRVAIFAVVLACIQKAEGTPAYFCAGCLVFILIAALAFNAGGGLTRTAGAYVFSYSMLDVIVGLCYKAFLGEPATSHLADPLTDIEAYVGSIAAMYGAVIVSRRFTPKTGLLQNLLKEPDMYRASVGCMVFGFVGVFLVALLGQGGKILQSGFAQLNQLIPLGILIGVLYEIRRSGGTRCSNIFIVLGASYVFFIGVTGFTKQGMLTPFICWILPIGALRFRLSVVQALTILVAVFVTFHYLVPFSQYGRGLVPENATLSQRIAIAVPLLEHPEDTRQHYEQGQADYAQIGLPGEYFDSPQGFWDRLQFISLDDLLINLTDQGKVVGLAPIIESFVNVVPHFIWPSKPLPKFTGNYYAHELGGLVSDEDTATGISFSPTAEAFHIARWVGIFIVAPLLWFLLFVIFDSLLGDLRASAWGLLAFVFIAHIAPEGGLSILIYLFTFGTEILVFCALFATFVAPVLGTFVVGPGHRNRMPLGTRG
jgi:hypothetical protein